MFIICFTIIAGISSLMVIDMLYQAYEARQYNKKSKERQQQLGNYQTIQQIEAINQRYAKKINYNYIPKVTDYHSELKEEDDSSSLLTGVLIGEALENSMSNSLNSGDNDTSAFEGHGGEFGGGGASSSWDDSSSNTDSSYDSSDSSSYDSSSDSSSYDSGSSSDSGNW